jgi:hypothetical protein
MSDLLKEGQRIKLLFGLYLVVAHHGDPQIQNRPERFYQTFLSPKCPGGAYVVAQKMPEHNGEFQYRVRSTAEPHERVVSENELTTAP